MREYLFIMYLISSPYNHDSIDVETSGYEWLALQKAGNRLCVDLELHHNDEFFEYESAFNNDIEVLRSRYHDSHGLPSIQYMHKLPSLSVVEEYQAVNRRYRKYLQHRYDLEIDRHDVLWRAMRETDALYEYWNFVHWLHNNYCIIDKRKMLAELGMGECYTPPPAIPSHYTPYWKGEEYR